MVFNISGFSPDPIQTKRTPSQKRETVEKKLPVTGSVMGRGALPHLAFAGKDSFEKARENAGESSTSDNSLPVSSTHGRIARGDELEAFIQNLHEESKINPELELIPPQRPPGLKRSESFHESFKPLSNAWTEPELATDHLTSPPKPLPDDVLEMRTRRHRRGAMADAQRPQPEVLIKCKEVPAEDEPENDASAQTQQPESADRSRRRHHQRMRYSPEEAQAALQRAREIAASRDAERVQSPAPVHGSHEELVQLLKIPYRFTVLGRDQVVSIIDAKTAASVMKEAHRFAIGDMHGSFHKLVETLVLADMVKMPAGDVPTFLKLTQRINKYALRLDQIAKEQRKIDTALKEGKLTQEKFDEDREKLVSKNARTLDKLEVAYWDMQEVVSRMEWKGGDRQITLIGDVLSDRGPLDMVTLDIIGHLSEQAPHGIQWLASNHDHNANSYITYGRDDVFPEQAVSLHHSINLADRMGSTAELAGQYYDYLSNSKLMHLDASNGTLVTHAPITEAQLKKLGSLLPANVPKVDEIQDLAQVETFVKAANQFYKDYINQCRQRVMDELEAKESGKTTDHIRREMDLAQRRAIVEPVLIDFVWSRSALSEKKDLPFHRAGVKTLVHGHDMESGLGSPYSLYKEGEKLPDYSVATLDQDVRKADSAKPEEQKLSSLYLLA